ncbi:MAG: FUSC family protein [Dongiaceae bacterium]
MQLGIREGTLSLKAFAGAMLAALIAFAIDFEKPAWAVLTAYIVAQPYAGMVQSKALYRVIGTLAGGVFAVITLGNLSSAPEILVLVLALWLGVCVYFSLLDRSARGYAFMLAGYTASIICFPSVEIPGQIFDIAVSRCEEIILGIVCALVVNQIIWPQSAGAELYRRLNSWMADATKIMANVLREQNRSDIAQADQRRLLSESLAVNALREHAVFDTPALRNAHGSMLELQHRMLSLMSVLSAIEDRLAMLRDRHSDLLTSQQPLLAEIADYVSTGQEKIGQADESREAILASLDRAKPLPSALAQDRDVLLFGTLIARLGDALRLRDECRELLRHVAEGHRTSRAAAELALSRDHFMAMWGGLGAGLSILLCNTFWVLTAWPAGAGMVVEVGVVCAFFAGADDPARAATKFLNGTTIGVAAAIIYALVFLPAVHDVPILLLTLAIFYIPFGLVLAQPTGAAIGLPIILGFTTSLDIQNNYTLDLADLLNSSVALIGGVAAATLLLQLFRSFGGTWATRRLIAATRRDLVRVALQDHGPDHDRFESQMFDRLNNFLGLKSVDGAQSALFRGMFATLRVGLNLFLLDEVQSDLPTDVRNAVTHARIQLARLCRGRASPEQVTLAGNLLKRAIAEIAATQPTEKSMQAIMALGGISFQLQAHAAFFIDREPGVATQSGDMVTA